MLLISDSCRKVKQHAYNLHKLGRCQSRSSVGPLLSYIAGQRIEGQQQVRQQGGFPGHEQCIIREGVEAGQLGMRITRGQEGCAGISCGKEYTVIIPVIVCV